MSKKIFKKYDIRGIVDKQLNQQTMQAIGYGFAKESQLKTCMIGRDIRKTSPTYAQAITQGLRQAGCNVIDIGVCSTAQLKWAVAEEQLPGAVMITASHNPPNYNGVKLYTQSGTPYGQDQGMHALQEYLKQERPDVDKKTTVQQQDMQSSYVAFLKKHLPTNDTEVFIDPSAGAACQEVEALAEAGNYNWTLYNAQPDPQFKTHSPNPLDPEAHETACEYSALNNCISVILDGDADRILFVDETGNLIAADYLAAWLAQDIVQTGAASSVNASRALKKWCEKNNKEYHQVPVGWIYIQNALIEHNLDLGSEKSGHIFFKEAHNAEAPLLCLLLVLKKLNGARLADVIAPYKEEFHSSKEHNYAVNDREEVLSAAKKAFTDLGELDEADGVLIEADNYWLSLRASNTEPLIRITWEAQDQETYNQLKERLESFIQPYKSSKPSEGH